MNKSKKIQNNKIAIIYFLVFFGILGLSFLFGGSTEFKIYFFVLGLSIPAIWEEVGKPALRALQFIGLVVLLVLLVGLVVYILAIWAHIMTDMNLSVLEYTVLGTIVAATCYGGWRKLKEED